MKFEEAGKLYNVNKKGKIMIKKKPKEEEEEEKEEEE